MLSAALASERMMMIIIISSILLLILLLIMKLGISSLQHQQPGSVSQKVFGKVG